MPTGGGGPSLKVCARVSTPRSMVSEKTTQIKVTFFLGQPIAKLMKLLKFFCFAVSCASQLAQNGNLADNTNDPEDLPAPRSSGNQLQREVAFQHRRCRASGIPTSDVPCVGLRLATLTSSSSSQIQYSTTSTARVVCLYSTGIQYFVPVLFS